MRRSWAPSAARILLYGPLLQLQAATSAAGVAEVSRVQGAGPELLRHVRRATVVPSIAAVANMAVLLLLPDELGRLVLGDTWAATERVLWPAGVQVVFGCLVTGRRSALLGLRAVRTTLRVDIVTSVLLRGLTVVGAVVGGLVTAYWWLAVGQVFVTLLWFIAFWDHVRRLRTGTAVVPATA